MVGILANAGTPSCDEFIQRCNEAPELFLAPAEGLEKQCTNGIVHFFRQGIEVLKEDVQQSWRHSQGFKEGDPDSEPKLEVHIDKLKDKNLGPLDEVFVEGCDSEQVWQQVELRNDPLFEMIKRKAKSLARIFANSRQAMQLIHEVEKNDNEEKKADQSDSDESEGEDAHPGRVGVHETMLESDRDSDDEDDQVFSEAEIEDESTSKESRRRLEEAPVKKQSKASKGQGGSSDKADDKEGLTEEEKKIEDDFFSWKEMDEWAEEDERSHEEGEDLEEGSDDSETGQLDVEMSDDDAENMMYDDFFGPAKERSRKRKRPSRDVSEGGRETDQESQSEGNGEDWDGENDEVKDEENPEEGKSSLTRVEEGSEEEDGMGILSKHQRQQRKMQKEIERLEEAALAPKDWLLRGEASSSSRPENSLLGATVEFEHASRPAPEMTEERTETLEEMIKQRIRDEMWDDVIRRDTPLEKEKKAVAELSQEKSKLGLGEEYEKAYLKQVKGIDEENDKNTLEEKEISRLFKSLCNKLDALSNFHFTPRSVVDEVKVVSSAPAISMEEAVPMAVSDANLRAPEEVYEKKRGRDGVVRGEEEITSVDRKRMRQAKKAQKRKEKRRKQADEKLVNRINPGLGNPYAKKKLLEDIRDSKNVREGKSMVNADGKTTAGGDFTKSSKFFAQLQQDVARGVQAKAGSGKTPVKHGSKSSSSFKL